MSFLRGHRSDRGMTLPEVMIASSILLVCLTSLAALLGTSVTSASMAKVRDEAANLANERIEPARSLPYHRVGTKYANGVMGDPAGDILTPETVGKFVVTTDCSWIRTGDGRAAYKQMTVRVAWTQPSPGQVEVTTMIYGRSGIATSGDIVVKLRYREDGAQVTNAAVAVRAADNSARAISSDANGEAFFGQVAVGPAVLEVTPPAGYVVDSSSLASMSVTADAVSTVIVYVQRPATTTVRVADTNGTPISGASVALRRADGTNLTPVTTDAAGDAVFPDLLYADYSATVTKVGYSAASLPFTVSVGQPAPVVHFAMTPTSSVSLRVRVFDTNGTQMPGALVRVRRNGNSVDTQIGTSGSNGEISFTGLEVVSYSVTVEKAGYVTQSQTVTLNGTTPPMDFHLSAAVSKGSMHILTLDKNGHAASLRVIVSGAGYYRNDLYSGATGSLDLAELVPGSYTVQCYTNPASVATVIINAGQIADVTIGQSKK